MAARARSALVLATALFGSAWAFPTAVHADVVLTTQNLNAALKTLARLHQQSSVAAPADRADLLFAIADESDRLAALLSAEIAAHGTQERALLDLAVERTRELGVHLDYDPEKRKFFYDGAGFAQYLTLAPRGTHAAAATFKTIEGEFYRSTGDDEQAMLRAVERKKAFLARYPAFPRNVEVNLMLAIDYRDLFRVYADRRDSAKRERYRALVRRQLRFTARRFRGTEQAGIAEKLLQRFDEELGTR